MTTQTTRLSTSRTEHWVSFQKENKPPPLTTDSNHSYERKPGGSSGSTLDTQDNLSDFQLLTSSDPQNTMSPPTPGVTPSPTPMPTPSSTPTPSPLPAVAGFFAITKSNRNAPDRD
jgi:hypothetical protein